MHHAAPHHRTWSTVVRDRVTVRGTSGLRVTVRGVSGLRATVRVRVL